MPYVFSAYTFDADRGRAEQVAGKVRMMLTGSALSVDVEGIAGAYYVVARVMPGTIPSLPSQMDGIPIKIVVVVSSPFSPYPYYDGPRWYGGPRGPWRGGGHHRPPRRRGP